jgi:hypothetical protein
VGDDDRGAAEKNDDDDNGAHAPPRTRPGLRPVLDGGAREDARSRVLLQQDAELAAQVGELDDSHVGLDSLAELARRLEPMVAVLAERLVHHRLDLGRHVGVQLAHPRDVFVDDVLDDAHVVLAGERLASGDELVEHRAEREEVAALIDALSEGLLRRHVERRADDGVVGGVRRERLRELGQTEVGDLGAPGPRQHDVARFDVAVDDALGVRVLETETDLVDDGEGEVGTDGPPALEHFLDAVPLDELHDDLVAVLTAPEVDDVDDVLVVEGGRRLGLENEAPREVLVLGEVLVEAFDGDNAIERGLNRLVQDGRSSRSNGLDDLDAAGVAHCGHLASSRRSAR